MCLYNFSKLNKNERVKNKVKAFDDASRVGWDTLIKNYIKAHDMAVDKAYS